MKNMFCDSEVLTNEASVEQFFVSRLLMDLGYKDENIAVKRSLKDIKIGKGSKSELFKPDYLLLSGGNPVIVLDAKNPDEDITKWTLQCSSYCLELNKKYDSNPVKYYVLTNGLSTAIYQWDKEKPLLFLDFKDFKKDNPKYQALKEYILKFSVETALSAEHRLIANQTFSFGRIPLVELLVLFQQIHSYIWKKEKKKPSSVFEELMKLIFIKLQKDKDLHAAMDPLGNVQAKDVVFSTHWIEAQTQSENPINDILFHNLVRDLEKEINANRKKRIFDATEEVNLSSDTIHWVVGQLEHVDLFGMEEDVHGRMFESFLEATVRGKELGQFFTPRDIVRLMVELADVTVTKSRVDKVLDACCGSGGFLIQTLNRMTEKAKGIPGVSNKELEKLEKAIQRDSIYGIDAGSDPKIYRLARMNMYLHGDGGSNIYFADSLDKNIGAVGRKSVEYSKEMDEIRDLLISKRLRFDVILSNPPFSLKYSDDDKDQVSIIKQYELYAAGGKSTKSLLSSVMFLERYKELVADNGRIAAIIDESVLSGDSYTTIRSWIRESFIVEAIISLPGDAFKRCEARVKTSILVLRLKQSGETQPDLYLNYAVRLGLEDKIARRIGIDTRTLEEDKNIELNNLLAEYRAFKAGISRTHVYPASVIADRMDVKHCIGDTGRKKPIWRKCGYIPVTFGQILLEQHGRKIGVQEDTEYPFLKVNYRGEVLEGETKLGSECSYSSLFQVEKWDILISNMGVGRGAIGIVPPYHAGKFVSNEYTIVRAASKQEAIYYSGLIRTKEILGDVLSTTTGMNRGRIDWEVISRVEIPEYNPDKHKIENLVKDLEDMWTTQESFYNNRNSYLVALSDDLELNDEGSQERWLGFKPPE